jgi:hypothetical protein
MKRRTNGVLYGVAPDDHDGPDPDHASERAKGYAATAALRRLIYSGQALNLIEVPCSCAPGTLNTRQAITGAEAGSVPRSVVHVAHAPMRQ